MSDQLLTDPEKDLKLKAYLVNNKDRVEQWAKAYEGTSLASNPPIYWDESIRDFIWLNRKQRRDKRKTRNS